MSVQPIHYELYSRRTPQSGFVLQLANEDRNSVLSAAEELMVTSQAIAVKVTKETLDPETGEFKSVTILNKGLAQVKQKSKTIAANDAACTGPHDMYTVVAREKIARLLEDWLRRNRVSPFELLHRPDLAERLEASGTELQHIAQKLAVPEASETGQSVHEIIRRWQALIERTTSRVIQDGRKKLFPELDTASIGEQVDRMVAHPERAYVLGGAIAMALSECKTPSQKLKFLLGPLQTLSQALEGREWAFGVFEIPVLEIFASKASLAEVLDLNTKETSNDAPTEYDLGACLCMLTRLAATREADLVTTMDPTMARVLPALNPTLQAYADLMRKGHLRDLSLSVSKRLMSEIKGPRRLRPHDPVAEIETLRALALIMTASCKEEHQRNDVNEAFQDRSRMLVSADFVENLMAKAEDANQEVAQLMWLCENVAGGSNKRQAARWLVNVLGGMKFEREVRSSTEPVTIKLSHLAKMQKRVYSAKLSESDCEEVRAKIGAIGAQIATDSNLLAQIIRSSSSDLQKLSLLLGLASGQAGPRGALSDQAKSEAVKLLKTQGIRQQLSNQPQLVTALLPMMREVGLAA